MSIKIPNPKKQVWQGILPGDMGGSFIRASNIDLEKQAGRLLLADRTKILTDNSDVSGMRNPLAFVASAVDNTAKWWSLTDSILVKTSGLSSTSFAADALTGTPTSTTNRGLYDIVQFTDNVPTTHLLVTGILDDNSTNVYEFHNGAGGWNLDWITTIFGAHVSFAYSPMAVLSNILLIGSSGGPDQSICTVDGNLNYVENRLLLSRDYTPSAIYTTIDRAWIMGRSLFPDPSGSPVGFAGKLDRGIIYEWDGGSDTVNNSYPLPSLPISGFIAHDLPYFILRNGMIVKFFGAAFKPIAFFPNYEEFLPFSHLAIKIKGCTVDGDLVRINLQAPTGSRKMRSGIWLFNVKTGNLYPAYATGQYKGSSNLDFGQAIISAAGGVYYDSDRDLTFVGSTIYTSYSASVKYAISTVSRNDTNGNRGYFVTPILPSSKVEEYWYNLWLRFPSLKSNIGKINGKYRVTDGLYNSSYGPVQLSVTWVSTTQMTAVLPVGVTTGHEIEILGGDNAGCLFHISTLSATPDGIATITITLDEAAPVSSTNVAYAEFNDWVKITDSTNPISSLTKRTEHMTLGAGGSPGTTGASGGPYIQLKIELRGILTGIDQLMLDNDNQVDDSL